MLKMMNLEQCFNMAKIQKAQWVAVAIETKGNVGIEIIINPNTNFQSKLEYYKKAYTDDLVLKSYDGIKIVGFTYADTLNDIEDDLVNGRDKKEKIMDLLESIDTIMVSAFSDYDDLRDAINKLTDDIRRELKSEIEL